MAARNDSFIPHLGRSVGSAQYRHQYPVFRLPPLKQSKG